MDQNDTIHSFRVKWTPTLKDCERVTKLTFLWQRSQVLFSRDFKVTVHAIST